ncbi:MAG: hypothetical protein ACSLE1_05280 [Sphingobium sp.]
MRRLARLATVAALLYSAPAAAGAWNQEQGKGQVIVTGLYSHSDKGFSANGHVTDIDDYEKYEAYLLLEYGLTDDITLLVNPSLTHQGSDGSSDDVSGLGYTEAGARYRVAQGTTTVLSLQGTTRIAGETQSGSLAQLYQVKTEFDTRALIGKSFTIATRPAFIDVQAGYRFRSGGPPNEFRADATLGYRPAKGLLLLAQSFNVFSDGSGSRLLNSYRYHNLYLSGVYEIDRKWSVQIGGLGTLAGKNALRERGLVTGLWYRF